MKSKEQIKKEISERTDKKFNLFDKAVIGIAMLLDDILKSKIFQTLLIEHSSLLQYVEFALIGAVGTAINGFIYFLLRIYFPDFLSWLLGILASFTFNFVLDKYLVFDKK